MRIVGKFEHVDVFVAELANDGMDADPFDADTGTHRINPLIMAHDSHLRAFSRLAHDALDLHDSVVDLRDFQLEKPFHENGIGSADDDLRTAAGIAFDLLHHGSEHIALSVAILVNLLAARKNELYLIVDDQHLSAARLIHLANDDLADELGVILVDILLFDVANPLAEGLPRRHYGPPPEVRDTYLTGDFVANLEVLVDFQCVAELYLRDGVLQIKIRYDLAYVDDLDVPVIGIEDNLEGVIGPIALTDH